MKKIKLFLASSITELESDRDKFQAFIDQLNEVYFDYGIRISLYRCETGDISISDEAGGKQAEFDREICDSDLCIFLFFQKVGEYTRHEFDVALKSFKERKSPKIVTYFKYVHSPEEASDEINAFMQLLDTQIKHYYNLYQNIDTLKLGILMQLKLMKLGLVEPCVENGKVMLGKAEIADTANMPIFTGNASLSQYRSELKDLTERCEQLRRKRKDNPDDEALYSEFCEVSSRKAEVEKKIKEIEKSVLEMTRIMTENIGRGDLSPRQIHAYRALERGDYSLALEILDFDEIMSDLAHNEEMGEEYVGRIQINVNELLQRIGVLRADGIVADEAAEIKNIYQIVYERIKKFNLEKSPLYDYAYFLYIQNDYTSALAVAGKLKYYYSDPECTVEEEKVADLYNLFGVIYDKQNNYKATEESFNMALEIYKRLAEQNPTAYESDLALCYNNLGYLCNKMNRLYGAIKNYKMAFEINQRLLNQAPLVHMPNMAMNCLNLGNLFELVNRFEDAEESLKTALGLYKILFSKNPSEYENYLAMVYNNLGHLYSDSGRYKESEDNCKMALEIYNRLAAQNPSAYEPNLAVNYINFGDVYCKTNRFKEAEEYLNSALEIYKSIAVQNPTAYEPNLAANYVNLGYLYNITSRFKEAIKFNQMALEINKRLAAVNLSAFEPNLAANYLNLGTVYYNTNCFKEAEVNYNSALEIYKRLSVVNPLAYEKYLAKCHINFVLLYDEMDRIKEEEESCKMALEIYKRMADQNPSIYEPELATCYNFLGYIYDGTDRLKEAEEMYRAAYDLAKKYSDDSCCREICDELKEKFE